MAEKNEYFTQKLENGTLQISEDVVASVAAAAVLEVEGVCGLSSSISTDIAEMLASAPRTQQPRHTSPEEAAWSMPPFRPARKRLDRSCS